MGKKFNTIMKTEERRNKGFTIIELVTAIGIMAVLSVAVIAFMSTSSKTYTRLSVESQVQSEAQLVANMITELAIDSFDAADTTAESFGYESGAGKILVLDSMVDGDKKQYIVGLKSAENSLYLAERTYDAANGTWGPVTEALLGNYIVDFQVNADRVPNENMLMFTLCYDKNGREYVGNYQVLMRNRAYADTEVSENTIEANASLAINLSPQLVYIDIVNERVPSYYIDTITESSKRTATDAGIPFTATVYCNQASANDNVVWKLKNEDSEVFKMDTEEGQTSNLTWTTAKKSFRQSPTDMFTLAITKTIPVGEGELSANPKTAQILLRRIKSINLFALSGATGWTNQHTEAGGEKAPEANGYVYEGSNGKIQNLELNAAITASNIAYGGGLTWELYMKNAAGGWDVCDNTSFASLRTKRTETSTTNTVQMGTAAKNGQVYKVVATSIFDPSWEAEYVFGVAPSMKLDGDGFNSRGYYTNMSAFFDGKTSQSDNVPVSKLVYLKVVQVDGAGDSDNWRDKVKIVQDASGNWRLYVDFDAFAYSAKQKESFYGGSLLVHLAYGYYGTDGKLYLNVDGAKEGAPGCLDEMASLLGLQDKSVITQYPQGYKYFLNPVVVTKVGPLSDTIVLKKGDSRDIKVQTSFYNILSPRSGTYFFGAYIDDMRDNLLQKGKSNVNSYFVINMTSQYGDVYTYVDNATVNLSAKSLTEQRKYLDTPAKIRLTANDYYMINPSSPNSNSYTDYNVVIANVEGTDCFMPGPELKANSAGFTWPSTVGTSDVAITGLKADGNSVTGTVYKSDKKYYLKYAGRTYTYNSTYNFWAK